MAKYKADPFYEIESGNVRVRFDYFGNYETDDKAEIEAIDALCPVWVKRIDEPEEDAAPKATPATPKKPSAK